jgi:uncharacterized delta-60 repeat protein
MNKVFFLLLFFLFGYFYSEAQYLYGLDPTFAANGIYMGDTGAVVKMAVQPDGKIVITEGEKKLSNGIATLAMRFNNNGSIDSSFSNDGRFFIPSSFGYIDYRINALRLQSDGKIILGGLVNSISLTNDDFFLVRIKPNGEPDTSFGDRGHVITDIGTREQITSIAVQPDGKIVACGSSLQSIIVVRYQSNGLLDSSFGVNGIVSSGWNDWGFTFPSANDIFVTTDGRIVVGADTDIDALNGAYAVTAIRLLPNGNLDTNYNHTGVAYTNSNLPGIIYCKSMCLQQDGKAVLGCYADSLAIVRFDSTGQLDIGFGQNGLVKLNPAGKVLDMLLQPDGKILLATNPDAAPDPDSCYTIYRVLHDGSIDTSFGIKGKLLTKPNNTSTMLGGISLQSDGKLLALSGYIPVGMQFPGIMIARYNPDASTGISTVDLNNYINIYPNPATSYINIGPSPKGAIQHIFLYSLDGKLLLTQTHPYTDRLSTEGLANGIYYLKLSLSNHQQVTKKIIIQK